MRTDRELLELAARANWAQEVADDEISLRYCEINDGILYLHADNQDHNGHDREFVWNPLEDDGDALRLAADLDLFGDPSYWHWLAIARLENSVDKHANVRRAIVRAAAAIGKEM